jgi:small GTP-binding protein
MQTKVLFVGPNGTGKTCLVKKLCTNLFEKKYLRTVGFEVYNNIEGYCVFDTAGHENYRGLTDSVYENSHIGIIFLDNVEDKKTIFYWIKEIEKFIPKNKIGIVVTKSSEYKEEIFLEFPILYLDMKTLENKKFIEFLDKIKIK